MQGVQDAFVTISLVDGKGKCHGPATTYSYHQQLSWQLRALQLPGEIVFISQAT